MNKFKDPFEEFIRNSLERQKIRYNAAHWKELEQKLDRLHQPIVNKFRLLQNNRILQSVGALLIASAIVYFTVDLLNNSDQKELVKAGENTIVKENSRKPLTISTDANATGTKGGQNNGKASSTSGLNSSAVKAPLKNKEKKSTSIAGNETKPGNNKQLQQETVISHNLPETASTKPLDIVPSRPNINFNVGNTKGCEKLLTDFTLANKSNDYSYKWAFGDGTTSEEINPKHLYSKPGVYDVTLTAISKNGDKKYVSNTASVLVSNKPKAEFEWNLIPMGSFKFGADFYDRSEDAVEWIWNFGDKKSSYEKDPKHIYLSKGTYMVELIIKNASGCSDTTRQFISVEDKNTLLAPNSFSPDGDGLNDTFIPKALEISDLPFEMSIYDPSGLIFKTNDKNRPWDGKNNNSGAVYQVGSTFRWSVTIKDSNGMEQNYVGNVSIVNK